jgi:hypothetical protein
MSRKRKLLDCGVQIKKKIKVQTFIFICNFVSPPGFVPFTGGNNRLECDCDLSKLVLDCGANSVKLGFAAPGLINPSR